MDRRFILALVLTAAVVIGVPLLFPTPPRPPVAAATVPDSLLADSVQRDSLARLAAAPAAAPVAPAPQVAGAPVAAAEGVGAPGVTVVQEESGLPPATADTVTVTTPLSTYRFSNVGAAPVGTELERYGSLRAGERERRVELSRGDAPLLGYRLVVPGDTLSLRDVRFTASRGTSALGAADTPAPLIYTGALDGMQVTIAYSFLPDSYQVHVQGTVAGAPARSFLLVDLPTGLRSSETDPKDDLNHLGYVYKPTADDAKGIAFRKLDPGETSLQSRPLSWAAVKNKYFVVALLAPPTAPFAELQVTGGARTEKVATNAAGTVVTPLTEDGAFGFTIFAGPQEWRRLLAVGRDFQNVNPYGGWLQAVVQPFAQIVMSVLLWMKDTTALNYGWVLVIFGVVVRLIMWPLNQGAMRTQIKMQRIQPELQAVQKLHAKEPQKQQQEIMRVYKEHGMSPFSSLTGCLPMLLPMPILFALFFVFQNTIEFRGVSFLWLHDISTYDPYFIMPILTGVTSFVMSWIGLRGSPPNPQAKLFAYVMPLTFAVLFARMAAGLHIYYTIQNLAALPQQYLLARERSKAAPASAPVVRGTPVSARGRS